MSQVLHGKLVTTIQGFAFHGRDLVIKHPCRVGKNGFDKDLSLSEIVRIATENDCNFILRASESSKWYIKTKRTHEEIEFMLSNGTHYNSYGARTNPKSVICVISSLE